MNNNFTYLALGDSYTIGEGVPLTDSYPYQTVQLLRKAGKRLNAPEILAKTGWTTSDLTNQLNQTVLNPVYDFVSLLIGVNNQYRGQSSSQYTLEFEQLLIKSIEWGGNKNKHVFVLSIPDWGVTPYARGRDSANISEEIRLFNDINRVVSKKHQVNYLDITTNSPENYNDLTYLSGDGLHPSAKAYARWAKLLAEVITSQLSRG